MNLLALVKPKPALSESEISRGLGMMTWEGAAALGMFSVTTSGLLVGFALALGANNLQIGMLAAIPFITQLVQLPGILVVERLRWRKAITLASWIPAQLMWVVAAIIPFFIGFPSLIAVTLLLAAMAFRGLYAAITNCSWNSWVRDLVPQGDLGWFFSRRLAWGTAVAIVFGLGGALFVDWWQARAAPGEEILGYTYVLLFGAVLLGLASPFFLMLVPEPRMQPPPGPRVSLWGMVAAPFRDRNFRQLTNFLFFWGFAVNLAVPFLTVFMLQRLGFPISAVIGLNILSQLAMILFLRVWGPFTDWFGSKVVMSLSASLYLLAILGWTFTTLPEPYFLTIPLVIVLQIFAGIAAAGVNLTTGTIGLKLAPVGQGTSYLVVASMAAQLGTGLGPLAGGLLADFFSTRRFTMGFEWADATGAVQFPAFTIQGLEFLFAIAVVIGLITLNTLTTVKEEGEVGREVVLEELMAPTRDMARTVGAIPGLRFVGGFPFAYLRQIPGMDVALGVTAYQIATTVKSALAGAHRGGDLMVGTTEQVRNAVARLAGETELLGNHGVGLARHAARGAIHALDEVADGVGALARAAVIGTVSALSHTGEDPWDILWEASYGTVQGAGEMGADVAVAAAQAVEAARDAARTLDLSEEEAVTSATRGVLAAAEELEPEVAAQVREAVAGESPD